MKIRVLQRQDVVSIGNWAHTVYLDWPDTDDVNFLNLLLTLNTMELGLQFTFSYEELEQIADDLIAGKDVTL